MTSLSSSQRQFGILSSVLFFVLPTCWILVFAPSFLLSGLLAEHALGPQFWTLLGFETGALNQAGSGESSWGITRVVPGGAFDRAGITSGDVPIRAFSCAGRDQPARLYPLWYHGRYGAMAGFYSFLRDCAGQGPVNLTVCQVSPDPCSDLCASTERTIQLEVPPLPPTDPSAAPQTRI